MPKASLPSFNQERVVDNRGMFSSSWVRYMQELWRRVGGGEQYNLGGNLVTNTTAVGNVGGGEDDLITFSLEGNTLKNSGDNLEVVAFGTFAANANNKTVKFYFGSDILFDTGAKGVNATHWSLTSNIIRLTSTTQIATTTFSADSNIITNFTDFVTATQTLTAPVIIKCTGTSAGSATDDIIQKGLIVRAFPA